MLFSRGGDTCVILSAGVTNVGHVTILCMADLNDEEKHKTVIMVNMTKHMIFLAIFFTFLLLKPNHVPL